MQQEISEKERFTSASKLIIRYISGQELSTKTFFRAIDILYKCFIVFKDDMIDEKQIILHAVPSIVISTTICEYIPILPSDHTNLLGVVFTKNEISRNIVKIMNKLCHVMFDPVIENADEFSKDFKDILMVLHTLPDYVSLPLEEKILIARIVSGEDPVGNLSQRGANVLGIQFDDKHFVRPEIISLFKKTCSKTWKPNFVLEERKIPELRFTGEIVSNIKIDEKILSHVRNRITNRVLGSDLIVKTIYNNYVYDTINELCYLVNFSEELIDYTFTYNDVYSFELKLLVPEYTCIKNNPSIDTVKKMLKALKIFHDKGFVHGNINPDNIMLAEDEAIVVDYGFSRRGKSFVLRSDPLCFFSTYAKGFGAPEYLSETPEITQKTDIWAFGVTLLHLFINSEEDKAKLREIIEFQDDIEGGRPNFSESDIAKMEKMYMDAVEYVKPEIVKSVISMCLKEIEVRPDAGQLLELFGDVERDFQTL